MGYRLAVTFDTFYIPIAYTIKSENDEYIIKYLR